VPPLFDMVAPIPYVELQKMLDESKAWGFYCYEKGTYIEDLSDAVIEVVIEQMPLKNPRCHLCFLPVRRCLQPGGR
jgi:hypothetical protein